MIVVDSSVWIAQLRSLDRPAVRVLEDLKNPRAILVGDIVLLEVLRGARDEKQAARIERELRRFRIEPMLDPDAAVAAAALYRSLRRSGITVRKVPDLLIAAFCVAHDYALLHDDRDFDQMAGLLGLRVVETS